ncbi:hypothetical protein B0A49_03222 [Cryomyces minteri]|uniref:Uncharacterized protein n=1 Tax=Cryomyces minteri TaxID=331657 RepID=A0A4U0XLF1_9PEZI|nr:hypothetical protein B0A49_03222 [Cryomyces minteri]
MSARISRDAVDVSRAFFQLEAVRVPSKDTIKEQNAALAPFTDDLGKIMHSITDRAKDLAEAFKSSPTQSVEARRPTDVRTSSRTVTGIHPPASKILDTVQPKGFSTLADLSRKGSLEVPTDSKKTTQRTANETGLSESIIEINGDYSKMKKLRFDGIFNILNYPESATMALELERQYYKRYLRIREDDLRVDEEQREAYRLAIEEEVEQGFGMELRRMKKEHDQSMVNEQQVLNVQMENIKLRGEIASLKEGLLPVYYVDYTYHGLDFHHHVVDGVFHSLEEANDKARSSFRSEL